MTRSSPGDASITDPSRRPILVTGAHRAGTTWAGRMLALPRAVAYIHEPFNLDYYAGASSARPGHWFEYVCEENAGRHLEPLGRTFRLAPDFRRRMASADSLRERARVCRTELSFALQRAVGARALIKDPLAVFSAPWIARQFGAAVVVLVRHPAAFVGSLKRAGWAFDFNQWLAQPLLMRDQLSAFRAEIEAASRGSLEIVDQGALLWNAIYATLHRHRTSFDDWLFVRHEDLARDPAGEFAALYDRLALPFSASVARQIHEHSSRVHAGGDPASLFELRRDSRATVGTWKDRLLPEEVDRVREATADWWPKYYDDSDW